MKHLVLLGAEHAHVLMLSTLAHQPLTGVRVTLVAPYPRQFYSGMIPGFVAGYDALEDCVIALAPLLAGSGEASVGANYPPAVQARIQRALERMQITVLQERATGTTANAVLLANGAKLACDVPLLATGAQAPGWLQTSGLALDDPRAAVATLRALNALLNDSAFSDDEEARLTIASHVGRSAWSVLDDHEARLQERLKALMKKGSAGSAVAVAQAS